MKTKKRFVALIMVLLFSSSSIGTIAKEAATNELPTPGTPEFIEHVMTAIDDMYRGRKSFSKMSMRVKTSHYTRTIEMESWSLGTKYSLVRIEKPKKDKGTATLKAKDDLYIYLKKTDRTIKVTSGMMGSSWMGSHFTNDDLMRHTRFSEDFRVTQDKSAKSGFYAFTLIPKPDAPVVWGKIKITVRQSDLQPAEQVFYDEDGKKVRQLTFSGYRKTTSGKVIPHRMIMQPLGEDEDEFTEIKVKEIDFKANINTSFFSVHKLRSL